MGRNNSAQATIPEPAIAGTYTLEEITASSKQAFGVQPEVIIGALHFKYKGEKTNYTKAEVADAIKCFRKKEVK